jgi:hypothetical protein
MSTSRKQPTSLIKLHFNFNVNFTINLQFLLSIIIDNTVYCVVMAVALVVAAAPVATTVAARAAAAIPPAAENLQHHAYTPEAAPCRYTWGSTMQIHLKQHQRLLKHLVQQLQEACAAAASSKTCNMSTMCSSSW